MRTALERHGALLVLGAGGALAGVSALFSAGSSNGRLVWLGLTVLALAAAAGTAPLLGFPRPLLARLASARATLEAVASALAVLDPQATLERGYAIVRRTSDERILRAPEEAPAGTALAIRLAAGELPATAADR